MEEADSLQIYKSLSLEALYNVLFEKIKEMCESADGKHPNIFMQKANEVSAIRSIIEEKERVEKQT